MPLDKEKLARIRAQAGKTRGRVTRTSTNNSPQQKVQQIEQALQKYQINELPEFNNVIMQKNDEEAVRVEATIKKLGAANVFIVEGKNKENVAFSEIDKYNLPLTQQERSSELQNMIQAMAKMAPQPEDVAEANELESPSVQEVEDFEQVSEQ
ncbi:hypothetical protein PCE1_002577 [Barthelona sp. PCE]